jgi:uncharacterized membrane protein
MTANRRIRRPPLIVRIVRPRLRLFASFFVGVIVTAAVTVLTDWRLATRLLAGWNVSIALYLVLAADMMARSDVDHIRERAVQEDEGQVAILALTVVAALASLAAIFAELGAPAGSGGARQASHIMVAILTTMLAWAFIHTIFALHYAHEFYDARAGGGMAFPGDDADHDYWDFVYFSFVIGMTSQVSDVGVTSQQIRRTVAVHSVVSFVFNAALLALTVNLAASAI